MLPCMTKAPADAEKYAKASYLWRDEHGKGMLRERSVAFGNGSLLLMQLQRRDTDTYYCDVFLPDETKDTVVHNVIGTAQVRFNFWLAGASPTKIVPRTCGDIWRARSGL